MHKNPSLFSTCSLIPFHRAQIFLSPLRAGFLNLGTIDILHQIILCYQRAALCIVKCLAAILPSVYCPAPFSRLGYMYIYIFVRSQR